MITKKDINQELNNAEKIIKDPKADVITKINVIYKLLEVVIKIVVNVRRNTTKIMEKLGVKLDEPQKKEAETKE